MTSAVARAGALAAITAVVQGSLHARPRSTTSSSDSSRRDGIRKVSARDLPVAVAQRADGATTVAASLAIAGAAGADGVRHGRDRRRASRRAVRRVGRPRRAGPNADGRRLRRRQVDPRPPRHARAPRDARRHRRRLSHRRAARLLHPHHRAPAAGAGRERRRRSPTIHRAARALGRTQATLVVQPPPADVALDGEVVDGAVERALDEARANGIRGAAVTPFLLAAVERATDGRSLRTNLATARGERLPRRRDRRGAGRS